VNSWPDINRPRLIRRMLVLGVVTLAFAILYIVLALADVGGSGGRLDWVWLVLVGGLGVLELLGAWVLRRDQAKAAAVASSEAAQRS
jgi:type VI protein secretion system component VasK